MKQTPLYRMMIVLAVMLLAVTSVGSAVRMAPADIDRAQVSAFLATGGTLDELCVDETAHNHAAHCPFCNTVASAQPIVPSGKIWTLSPDILRVSHASLTSGSQWLNGQNAARGPPVSA